MLRPTSPHAGRYGPQPNVPRFAGQKQSWLQIRLRQLLGVDSGNTGVCFERQVSGLAGILNAHFGLYWLEYFIFALMKN